MCSLDGTTGPEKTISPALPVWSASRAKRQLLRGTTRSGPCSQSLTSSTARSPASPSTTAG